MPKILFHERLGKGLAKLLGASLVIALLVWIAFSFLSPKKEKPGEEVANQGNAHIRNLETPHEPYNSIPPTSGPHLPRIAPWGIALTQVPDELQVHNLEDGGIVIQYDPTLLDGKTIQALQKLASSYPEQVLLGPYTKPRLPAPIVLTAWTRILKIENYNEEVIRTFIEAYRGIDHHVEKSR